MPKITPPGESLADQKIQGRTSEKSQWRRRTERCTLQPPDHDRKGFNRKRDRWQEMGQRAIPSVWWLKWSRTALEHRTVLHCTEIALTEHLVVLGGHVRIPALNAAMRSKDKRHQVRTEALVHESRHFDHHRAIGRHSCLRWGAGTRKRWYRRTEDARVRLGRRPSWTNCWGHTIFLPELSEGPLDVGWFARRLSSNTRLMVGGHHVFEEVASRRPETLSFVLIVRALAGLHGQHNAPVFLRRRRAAKIFRCFSKHGLVLLIILKHDRVGDGVFIEEWVPIDQWSGRHAPSANATVNCEICHPTQRTGWDTTCDNEHLHQRKEEKTRKQAKQLWQQSILTSQRSAAQTLLQVYEVAIPSGRHCAGAVDLHRVV